MQGRLGILVFAFAAFVAGVDVMVDARQGAILVLGELLAYGGVMLLIVWLLARGARQWIVYSVSGALLLAWLLRGVPPGGVSSDEVRKTALAIGILLAVFAVIELLERGKRRRRGAP